MLENLDLKLVFDKNLGKFRITSEKCPSKLKIFGTNLIQSMPLVYT
jgi:hypothetical protein